MTSEADPPRSTPARPTAELLICVNRRLNPRQPSCAARGAESLVERFEQAAARHGLHIAISRIYCLGVCAQGPNVRLAPGGSFWRGVGLDDVEQIVAEIRGQLLD